MTRPIVMITLISLSIFYALVTVPSMAQERDGDLQIIEDCIEQANTLINGWEKEKNHGHGLDHFSRYIRCPYWYSSKNTTNNGQN